MSTSQIEEKVYCRTCKRKTNHGIIKSFTEQSVFPLDDFSWTYSHYITQCLGCDTVAFVSEYEDETMMERNHFGEIQPIIQREVYPEEPIHENTYLAKPHEAKPFTNAPPLLKKFYLQIVSTFNQEFYILATVGLRMLIEGVCRDLNIKNGYILDEQGIKTTKKESEELVRSKSLEGKINGLVEKTIILASQAEILHSVREMGNASAHELQEPSRKTVRLALEILEKIMEQIYEFGKYHQELKIKKDDE
ncbi:MULTISPECIES: DUF4145 domain-containing protein [Exiguobacterium]|uniref:DUF4145 domain-containing protein n=1 Tax=Exiguobacterium TaxID=33986 RepID=UPI001BE8E702|nr:MULTISPECIES: DUF4145 domain-containing protein [Exiguobacterium]MCT4776387.1 DUF4145 domain-containing protein [Exiguobacterium aquaticum]MCT4789395.1 DUF4145 domain-containing protein [Exiguobacterium mexicanum]